MTGRGEPDGLLSMGSHRVRHDWSDLAAAAACDRWDLSSWFPHQRWNLCSLHREYRVITTEQPGKSLIIRSRGSKDTLKDRVTHLFAIQYEYYSIQMNICFIPYRFCKKDALTHFTMYFKNNFNKIFTTNIL